MSDISLECDRVWKRFRKGRGYDVVKDLMPALFRSNTRANGRHRASNGEFWALSDLSFQVKRGEAVAIIGPNGAGKSTTLKILSRIFKPTLGSIRVSGRMSALIEVTAGFHQDLTGRENIYLNGAIFGMNRSEIKARIDQIIDFSGISEFIDTPVKRYSSGMLARLGFSIAAHVNPEILLVDEVLSVGDYTFQGKCIRRMQEILRNGTTVVFVSHNMESVLSLCSRAILLRNGRIASEGMPAKVIRDYYGNGALDPPPVNASQKASIVNIRRAEDATIDGANRPGAHHRYILKIKANESCRLSPGIFVRRDGATVFETNYARMTGNVLTLCQGQTIELVWDIDLNLPPGMYELGFNLEEADTKVLQHYVAVYRTLLVAEDLRYHAQFHLNPRILMSPLP